MCVVSRWSSCGSVLSVGGPPVGLMCLVSRWSSWLLSMVVLSVCLEVGGAPAEQQGALLRELWRRHLKDFSNTRTDPGLGQWGGGDPQLLLYCRVGIGFHLQILPDGSVGGVHSPNDYCRLRVKAVRRGAVGIRGLHSGLFLCMSAGGRAYGAETFSDECRFLENLEENHYTTYSSLSHPGLYLALSSRGRLRRADRAKSHQACTHFLPRKPV